MLNRAYKTAIAYFLLFTLLLFLSGILIFIDKIGFSYDDVIHYYLGNSKEFIVAKTFTGLLKIILPHIFAFGLFIIVIIHFIIFTKQRNNKDIRLIIYIILLTALFEISSPFVIVAGLKIFAYVKIFTFLIFYLLILYIFFILFKSIIYDK